MYQHLREPRVFSCNVSLTKEWRLIIWKGTASDGRIEGKTWNKSDFWDNYLHSIFQYYTWPIYSVLKLSSLHIELETAHSGIYLFENFISVNIIAGESGIMGKSGVKIKNK